MSLDTWFMQGSWGFLDTFEIDPFLDKMEEAGVKHLAFGAPLPLEPNPQHYDGAIKGCPSPPAVVERAAKIRSFLEAAWARKQHIYHYGTNPHMCGVPEIYQQLPNKHFLQLDQSLVGVKSYWGACANGAEFLQFYLGRIRDVQQHFPQVEGFFNDGPEFGYEIAGLDYMDGNLDLFGCFGPCCEHKARELGYDFGDLKRAALHLMEFLHRLDVDAITRMLEDPGEPLNALSAAAGEERIGEWLRFKQDSIVSYIQQLCQGVKEANPALNMGVGSRLPAFTPLTGYDLSRLAQHADFLLPKIYLWMGGVDGLYGTVYRWAKTLKDWNPHLSEDLLFRFTYRLFGFELPQVENLADILRHIEPGFADITTRTYLGAPFPKEFFTEVVADQVRLMIAQVGDAGRVRPWTHVDHGGRVLTPDEMDQALSAATTAGLQTYLNYCPLEPGNWEVAVKHGKEG
jgi:hypothetical protein